MKNCIFTNEEISNFYFYSSDICCFDKDYEVDDEYNKKANRKAAETNFEILKIDEQNKIAILKDERKKVFYTSLHGCSCKQFQDINNDGPCVHMFKLAQELNIVDKDTGILLIPQKEVDEFSIKEYSEEIEPRKKEKVSTVGIGKHCKHCNKVMNYNDDICPHCGMSQEFEFLNTKNNYLFLVVGIIVLILLFIIF